MADAGLFIGWGQVVRGREERALEVFNETVEYYASLQQEGRIESFEVALLEPHGGDLAGFMLLRGSASELNALREDDEFNRRLVRADLVVDGLGAVPAAIGAGLERQMAQYREELATVPA
jgi:hypothetical protein